MIRPAHAYFICVSVVRHASQPVEAGINLAAIEDPVVVGTKQNSCRPVDHQNAGVCGAFNDAA
jgi:hypothetical protein